MVLIKRAVPGIARCTPEFTLQGKDVEVMLDVVNQKSAVGLLNQLATMFKIAAEIYDSLFQELSSTTNRIQDVQNRLQSCWQHAGKLESFLDGVNGITVLGTSGSNYMSASVASAQLLSPSSRPVAIKEQWDSCMRIPELERLDPFRTGEGKDNKISSHMYTNPDFFFLAWLEEQERLQKEAKERRREARKQRNATTKTTTKTAEVIEVKKMAKTRYDEWGNKITDDSDAAPAPQARRNARDSSTNAQQTVANDFSDYSPAAAPVAAQRESTSSAGGPPPLPPTDKSSNNSSSAPANREQPPPPPPETGSSSKAPSKKSRAQKTIRSKKSNSKPSVVPSPRPPEPAAPPPPSSAAPPPPPDSAPAPPPPPSSAPVAPKPAKMHVSDSSAPPPPAPPPPPAAPAPPRMAITVTASASAPPPPTAPVVAQHKAMDDDPHNGLLGQIRVGMQLRKVDVVQKKEPTPSDTGSVNVAAILARRMAIEMSDDDSESSEGGDWDNNDWN